MAMPRTETPPESSPRERSNGDDASPTDRPTDAFRALSSNIAELREYVGYFIASKVDGIKLSVRNLFLYAVLGIVGAIVSATIAITATVLVVNGIAGALSALLPGGPWVGALIIGLAILALMAIGLVIGMKKLTGASRSGTIAKYEQRKRDERSKYGHDVHDRAASGVR